MKKKAMILIALVAVLAGGLASCLHSDESLNTSDTSIAPADGGTPSSAIPASTAQDTTTTTQDTSIAAGSEAETATTTSTTLSNRPIITSPTTTTEASAALLANISCSEGDIIVTIAYEQPFRQIFLIWSDCNSEINENPPESATDAFAILLHKEICRFEDCGFDAASSMFEVLEKTRLVGEDGFQRDAIDNVGIMSLDTILIITLTSTYEKWRQNLIKKYFRYLRDLVREYDSEEILRDETLYAGLFTPEDVSRLVEDGIR